MDKDILTSAGFDVDDGVRRCGDNYELYGRLLSLFLQDHCLEAAQTAFAAKDYDALFAAVHELKGVSGNISIGPLFESSSKVVALLRAEDYDAIPEALEEMTKAYKAACEAIEQAQ